MKILQISDTHNKHQILTNLPTADVIVHCGDFTEQGTEEDFVKEIADKQYDIIIGDNLLKRAIKEYNGEFIDFPNFAISGRLW